jgi:hypothetical protein
MLVVHARKTRTQLNTGRAFKALDPSGTGVGIFDSIVGLGLLLAISAWLALIFCPDRLRFWHSCHAYAVA